MIKLSIGYQLPDEYDSIGEIVKDYHDNISSVYFAAPNVPSARHMIDVQNEEMFEELRWIQSMGVNMTLLYNANCYGANAVSSAFRDDILRTVSSVNAKVDITDLTTTSPFVAKVIKKEFPHIKICASVNMWIGTTQAMEYLGDDFDGYYMQREYNRNFEKIKELSEWCSNHGKQLKMLANSGCLYTCPFHIFHDNLVAHESEASKLDNIMSKNPSPCWDYMEKKDIVCAASTFLQESWVRPEDIEHYAPYFNEVKLATRMHSNPRRVVAAYARKRFHGNMLDLTEPSYSRRFQFHILDAMRFPIDWFERTSNCSKNCDECGFCKQTAKKMLVSIPELESKYLG